jgi:hypothetical protein
VAHPRPHVMPCSRAVDNHVERVHPPPKLVHCPAWRSALWVRAGMGVVGMSTWCIADVRKSWCCGCVQQWVVLVCACMRVAGVCRQWSVNCVWAQARRFHFVLRRDGVSTSDCRLTDAHYI